MVKSRRPVLKKYWSPAAKASAGGAYDANMPKSERVRERGF